MLIVNSRTLPTNVPKDNEMYPFMREYHDALADLKTRFVTGQIQLKRNGYPKQNRMPDGSLGMPEIPPLMMIKSIKTDSSGAIWEYCKGRPIIGANGLVNVPPNDSTISIGEEILVIDLKGKPDYAFFMMYKSGILGTEYTVHDPEGERMKELRDKNARNQVTNAIWSNMDEPKVRMMAGAYGIKNSNKADLLILKDDLEKKILAMDEEKKKKPNELMLKGIEEFLADARNDEYARPKALIQLGIDDKRITYDKNHFYFDGADICHVPFGKDTPVERQDYLAQFCRNPENKEKWLLILKGLLTKEYIETMDKYGVRYFAGQFDIALNQKEPDLKAALLEMF